MMFKQNEIYTNLETGRRAIVLKSTESDESAVKMRDIVTGEDFVVADFKMWTHHLLHISKTVEDVRKRCLHGDSSDMSFINMDNEYKCVICGKKFDMSHVNSKKVSKNISNMVEQIKLKLDYSDPDNIKVRDKLIEATENIDFIINTYNTYYDQDMRRKKKERLK